MKLHRVKEHVVLKRSVAVTNLLPRAVNIVSVAGVVGLENIMQRKGTFAHTKHFMCFLMEEGTLSPQVL